VINLFDAFWHLTPFGLLNSDNKSIMCGQNDTHGSSNYCASEQKVKTRIRFQGFLIFLAVIATLCLSKSLFPDWKQEKLDEFLDATGIGLVLFGFLFRISARGYKEEKSASGHALVKDDPYAIIRHPMYFGTLLIGIGIILALLQLWAIFLFAIIFCLIYIPQIRKEELDLLRRFPDEYRAYCKITPKFLPRIYNLLNIRDYLHLKLPWIRKEIISFSLVVFVIMAIEAREEARLFGGPFIKESLELFLILASFMVLVYLFRKERA